MTFSLNNFMEKLSPRSDKELGIAFGIFVVIGLLFFVAKLYGF